MTQRPDRQPEDIDSPLHPAADPDLEDGTEVPTPRTERRDAADDERPVDDPGPNSN